MVMADSRPGYAFPATETGVPLNSCILDDVASSHITQTLLGFQMSSKLISLSLSVSQTVTKEGRFPRD